MTPEQATKIMKLFETKSGVDDLEIDGISVWWFIRFRFYCKLLDYPRTNGEKEKTYSKSYISAGNIIFGCGKAAVFLLRSLGGLIRATFAKNKNNYVLFLVYPTGFKKTHENIQSDIYIGPIYEKLSEKSLILERPSLKEPDFRSFLFRKNVIFFDWAILFSIFGNWPRLLKVPVMNGWGKFSDKCEKIGFETVSSRWIVDRIKELVFLERKKIIIQIKAAEIILDKFKPKAIVETASYDSGTVALNLAAKRRNIPIVELQHGIISGTHCGYVCSTLRGHSDQYPFPDKLLVYGQAFKNTILRSSNAFLSSNIGVIGSMRMEKFLRENLTNKEKIKEKTRAMLGISQNIFLVVVTTQTVSSPGLSQVLKEALRAFGKKMIICIKPHPAEDDWRQTYKNILANPQVRVITDKDIDLYDLLVASDVHVTFFSTVFLECLALGVPNIILDSSNLTEISEFMDICGLFPLKTATEFVAVLEKIKNDEGCRKTMIEKGKKISGYFFANTEYPENLVVEQISDLTRDDCGHKL